MQGGGSKGAFEIGALWGLVKNDPQPEKYEWDVVTGVSGGSLNTAIVTGFAIGEEEKMVEYASDLFSNTENSDAYKMWKLGGLIRGLTDKGGLLDNSPAYDLVNRVVNELGDNKRKFTVSSVDVNSGAYYLMNDTLPRQDHARAFVASTLIPGVFEPDTWGNVTLMDGGTVYNVNLVSAVHQCRDLVDDDSQITIDIIVCGYPGIDNQWEFKNDMFANWMRYKDIADYHSSTGDVAGFMRAFPNVNFRHLIAPSESIASGLGILDFSNLTSTWPMQMIGRTDGANAVAKEGFLFGKVKEWNESADLQKQFPQVGNWIHKVTKDNAREMRKEHRREDAARMDAAQSSMMAEEVGEIPAGSAWSFMQQ